MELITLLQTLKRWLWLIIALVIVTGLVLMVRLKQAKPMYEAVVKIQLSIPQPEDVAAFDTYRYSSLRDEMTVARNNLTEVIYSSTVYQQVVEALGLAGSEARYGLEVRPVRDVDFVRIAVQVGDPQLAASIANAHVERGIQYYGELRAQPAEASKALLADQLNRAEQEFRAAENAFVEFRRQNRITSLEAEVNTYQRLLGELSEERDQRLLDEADSSDIEEVDALISEREAQLERLVGLGPVYQAMEQKALEARSNYNHLLTKYFEAEIKAEAIRSANFIQIVEAAQPPRRPLSQSKKLLVLGLAGSLGFGVLLAFLLDYVSSFRHVMLPVSELRSSTDSKNGMRAVNTTVPAEQKEDEGQHAV
jgi:uncharacterized protein involved in exopolysaccharide biosynthesis